MGKCTPTDYEPDTERPESIKELVIGALTDEDVRQVESIDQLMDRVYAHIANKALGVYHSEEPWALKQWILNNILKDEVIGEAEAQIAHELISPIIDWQKEQPFDPLAIFKRKLIAEGKSDHSRGMYMNTAAKFVAMKGRKRRYPDEDVIDYVAWLRSEEGCYIRKRRENETGNIKWEKVRYKPATIYSECERLLHFLQCLHGKSYEMPVDMPKMPDSEDLYQPTLSYEDIETLAYACVIDMPPADWIVRLVVSTIYGGRVSELGDIESKYINLDGANSTILIRTRKGGVRKAQPIPESLIPIFAVDIEPMKEWKLQYILRSMCKKAGVELPPRAGWHALRRRVVTDVYTKTNAKDMPIIDYFHWSRKDRNLSQLPTYVKTPTEVSDQQILLEHPMVKLWEQIVPLLMMLHHEYKKCAWARQLYHENI